MEKFIDLINALKAELNKQITTDSSTEQIEAIDSLKKKVDDIESSHNELVEEHKKMKDLYIKNVVNYGSADKPKDENSTPKTLEEIAKEVLANENK